jgi:hypothetical protein
MKYFSGKDLVAAALAVSFLIWPLAMPMLKAPQPGSPQAQGQTAPQ